MASSPEQLLISAVIRQRDHLTPIAKGITNEMFVTHQAEWTWLERYIGRHGRAPSRQAIVSQFPALKLIKVDDVEHYIEAVKTAHLRRSIITTLDSVATEIQRGKDPHEVLAFLSTRTNHLSSELANGHSEIEVLSDWRSIYDDVLRRVERVRTTGNAGIQTGFHTLDLTTGGIQPGETWIVAARTGNGKTWTSIRMSTAALWSGATVLFYSLEQSRNQIALRLHTFLSSNHGHTLFRNLDLSQGKNFSLLDYRKFLKQLPQQVPGKFYVIDGSRNQKVAPSTMGVHIERVKPDLVVVDYLTLLAKPGSEWTAIASLSAEIKQVAQRYQVPFLALAQINRFGIGKEPPNVEHLTGSDAVGQDADAVVTMRKVSTHVQKMRLAKYRHGLDNISWWAKFSPNTGEYEEISGDEAENIKEMDAEL